MSDVFWNNISCHEEGIAFHFLWEDCDISCTRGEAFCSIGSSASQWKNKQLWKDNETWTIIVNKSQFYVKSKNFFLIPVCAVTIRWSRAQKVFQCTHLISLSCVNHNHNDWPEEEKQNIPLSTTTWNLSSFLLGTCYSWVRKSVLCHLEICCIRKIVSSLPAVVCSLVYRVMIAAENHWLANQIEYWWGFNKCKWQPFIFCLFITITLFCHGC